MAPIIPYKTKSGVTTYTARFYKGLNPNTGNRESFIKRGFKTKKEAQLALARAQVEFAENGFQEDKVDEDELFSTIYEIWFSSYKDTIQLTTQVDTKRLFDKHILPKFGKRKIKEITPIYCQKVMNEWIGYYIHARKLKQYAQKIFEYAIDMEILEKNPMARVKFNKNRRKIGKKKVSENYDASILNKFVDYSKGLPSFQDHVMMRLLAYTGARKGEVSALSWRNVNLEEMWINIEEALVRVNHELILTSPKTDSSVRKVYIDETTVQVLQRWKKLQQEELSVLKNFEGSEYVFHRLDEENNVALVSPEYPNRVINHLIRKHDLPRLTPHDFRHLHASILLSQKINPKAVSERLGHSDIQTTLGIYTHVPTEQAKSVAKEFSTFVGTRVHGEFTSEKMEEID